MEGRKGERNGWGSLIRAWKLKIFLVGEGGRLQVAYMICRSYSLYMIFIWPCLLITSYFPRYTYLSTAVSCCV